STRPNGDARQPASQVRQAPEGSPVAVTLHAAEAPEVDYWESGALDSWGSIAGDAGSAPQGNDIAGRQTGIEWSIARPGELGVAEDGLFSMAMEGRGSSGSGGSLGGAGADGGGHGSGGGGSGSGGGSGGGAGGGSGSGGGSGDGAGGGSGSGGG